MRAESDAVVFQPVHQHRQELGCDGAVDQDGIQRVAHRRPLGLGVVDHLERFFQIGAFLDE